MSQLVRNVARMQLEPPIMNGAGTCKDMDDFDLVMASTAGAVVVGSATINGGTGNAGNVFDWDERRSLNSLGLPNPGLVAYGNILVDMARKGRLSNKPVIFSIAGTDPDDYRKLAQLAVMANVSCVEVNLGCPNKYLTSGKLARIACYDPCLVESILREVRSVLDEKGGSSISLTVKVSYFPDRVLMDEVASVISGSTYWVGAVVAINTLANALAFTPSGRHRLVPQFRGYSGLGGRAVKEIGLGQVQLWRDMLVDQIRIIGVGGISTGRDVQEYFWAGADAVQVTSELLKDGRLGVAPLERITSELVDIMDGHLQA